MEETLRKRHLDDSDQSCLPCLLLWIGFFASLAGAQTLMPSITYSFHSGKRTYGKTVMALTPDQALIIFLGRKKATGKSNASLGGQSLSPREETLALKGFPEGRVSEWGDYLDASLIVTPDGRYAITQLQTNAPGMLSGVRRNTEAIINVVDLRTIAVISTLDTTDPLLAGSAWRFELNGVFVAMIGAVQDSRRDPSAVVERAAALSVPSLRPEIQCTYREVYGPPVSSGDGALARARSITDLSENCSALLRAADARTVDDLIPSSASQGRLSKQLAFHPSGFTYLGRSGCSIRDVTKDEQLALYVCAASRPTWYDTVKATKLSYFIVSVRAIKGDRFR